jgi:phosphopantothenoylcysteine decarboxylase/phosphopantothenate--cysteine ligase
MHDAALNALEGADVIIAAAAVADFMPAEFRTSKSPKGELAGGINLVPTPDILESLGAQRRPEQILIGFALETGNGVDSARGKLLRKGADAIVLNYATAETGMDSDTNQISLVTSHGVEEGPLESKAAAARRILDWVERNTPSA